LDATKLREQQVIAERDALALREQQTALREQQALAERDAATAEIERLKALLAQK
jgi:hypothetical protein